MATKSNAAGDVHPAAFRTNLHQMVQPISSDASCTNKVPLDSDPAVVQDEPVMPGPRKVNRQALTIRIDRVVVARLKATAKEAAGRPFYVGSISDLVERAVKAECDRIDAELAEIFGSHAQTPITLSRGRLKAINCEPVPGPS